MRIDDPIFSGSVVGSDAIVSLSGSFTGSGTIENSVTASKLRFSASFGLGIENTFNFDGSANEVVQIDTASAHFIAGVHSASIDDAETGSFLITASIAGLTQSFTKGDGSTFEINLPDTGAVNLAFEITGGLGVDAFTFDNTANAEVQVNTASFHIANLTASLFNTASYSTGSLGQTVNTMSFTRGDGTVLDVHISNSVVSVTPSTVNNLLAARFEDGTTVSSPINTSSYAESSSFTRTATSASLAQTASYFNTDPLSASLTTTDQAISQSVLTTSASLTVTDQAISSSVAALSASASTSRDLLALQVSGAFDAVSASLTTTDQAISQSVLTTSASLTTTDQTISSSVATLSASAAAALTAQSASNAVDFVSQSIYNVQTGSFVTNGTISGLTQSFTKGDGTTFEINLPDTGSPTLSNQITGGLGVNPFTFNGTADADVRVDVTSSHFTIGVSASQAPTITALSASLTTTDQTISSSVVTTSASLTVTDQAISSSVAILSASAILNVETSSTRQVDTLTITKGDGSTFDVTHNTSSFVKTVNGVAPNAITGNVSTTLTAVGTGTSASMLAASSSGTLDNGQVWIISGETADPLTASNGEAYIFDSASGQLYELSNLDQVENDVRYVNTTGDTMTGALILSTDPTNVLGAATKQYVDPAFTTASMATGSDGRHTVTFTRLGGGTQTLTFTSASYAATASRVTASLTQGLGIENFDYMGGAAQQVQINTSSAHFIAGVSRSFGSGFNNISGGFTGSLIGTASAVEFPITSGSGIVAFSYVGNASASVTLDTSSAHFTAGVSRSLGGGDLSTANLEVTNNISIGIDSRLSSSAESRNYLEIHDTAHGAGAAELAAIDDIYLVSNADSGSAGDIVFASNISGTLASETMRIINNNATANKGLVFIQNDASASNFIGTSSISLGKASQGVAITMSTYDGSQNTIISVDTSSQAFADGVAIGLSSASFAGLSIDFSGSNLDFSFANLSGSDWNFSGSTIDFSDVNFSGSNINWSGSVLDFGDSTLDFSGATINLSGSTWNWSGSNLDFTDANFSGSLFDFTDTTIFANSASYSGSFNYNGASIQSASIEAATFTGSSAFTGAFDFSNATITGLAVSTNYLPTTQSANFTAAAARAYIITQSSAVVTMTLPATPSNGDSIKIANMDDRATIIARNGERIMGVAEDMTLNVEQVSFELMYESSTNMGWVIYGARAIT